MADGDLIRAALDGITAEYGEGTGDEERELDYLLDCIATLRARLSAAEQERKEWEAKLVGYEVFKAARTECGEGDGIWEFYDAKLWRGVTDAKDRCLAAEARAEAAERKYNLTTHLLHDADAALDQIAEFPDPLQNKNSALNQCDYLKSLARAALAGREEGE